MKKIRFQLLWFLTRLQLVKIWVVSVKILEVGIPFVINKKGLEENCFFFSNFSSNLS